MIKIIIVLAAVLLAAGSNNGTTAPVSDGVCEYVLYDAYIASNEWAWVLDDHTDSIINYVDAYGEFVITEKKIFDLDGDGTPELYLLMTHPVHGGVRGNMEISVLCTIVDGQVVRLLYGYASGGTMGGTYVEFRYNTELSRNVAVRTWYIASGYHLGMDVYLMEDGGLVLYESLWAHGNHHTEETVFEINSVVVSEEVYKGVMGKYVYVFDWEP
jgi:hypothetical protein